MDKVSIVENIRRKGVTHFFTLLVMHLRLSLFPPDFQGFWEFH